MSLIRLDETDKITIRSPQCLLSRPKIQAITTSEPTRERQDSTSSVPFYFETAAPRASALSLVLRRRPKEDKSAATHWWLRHGFPWQEASASHGFTRLNRCESASVKCCGQVF